MDNLEKEIWQDIIKEMSQELINEGLDIWFYSVKASVNANVLEIEVPNSFYIDQIKRKEERIKEIIKNLTGSSPDIKYTISPYTSPQPHSVNIANEKNSFFHTNLKSEYTFKELVIGEFNKFAATVSENIAKNSGSLPLLFIYSKPGLGKTHMLHAIGNEMISINPNKKILYITAEDFVNEFINSIKQNTVEQFRAKYRSLDCLLIDDIQFIVAKGRSEEEFFFTFNTLFEYKKIIVITSDRKPDDIELNERLISRFKNGILADIKPPEFEARVAILEKENEKNKYGIEKDIIDFLAKNIKDSIRSLKGALMKIYNFSVFTNEFPTIDKVKV
ncbi:MAG: DnaA ATPase domain-containing protein, partial [Elusimicrobiales bacterium]